MIVKDMMQWGNSPSKLANNISTGKYIPKIATVGFSIDTWTFAALFLGWNSVMVLLGL